MTLDLKPGEEYEIYILVSRTKDKEQRDKVCTTKEEAEDFISKQFEKESDGDEFYTWRK